jgi:hypothetical protein
LLLDRALGLLEHGFMPPRPRKSAAHGVSLTLAIALMN